MVKTAAATFINGELAEPWIIKRNAKKKNWNG
jgi:hypothetical protein